MPPSHVIVTSTLLWAALWLAASPLAASSIGPRRDICRHLSHEYKAAVFLKDDPQYPKLRTENWSQTAWRTPACIFRPASTRQLQRVVTLLVQSKTKFAIRSGGHSPSPRAANIDGGVLVDLSAFDHVSYHGSAQVAVIGSGLSWRDVYAHLAPFGVTVAGGRVGGVGVGGLTLGGGLSYLSDLYGLACDNVVNFETRFLDPSHADLHWALKAGTNNFGIVTSFTVSTYPIGQVWAGIKSYKWDDLPALYSAMFEYQTAPAKDPYANLMLQGLINNETATVVLSLVYLKPEESPAAFAPFYHINTTADSTKMSSWSEFIAGQGPPSSPPRAYFRTVAFEPSRDLYGSLAGYMTESAALEQLKSVTGGTMAFGMQPISTGLVQAGHHGGGNALGLSPVNQTWYVINSGLRFDDDDELVRTATHDILGPIVERSEAEDVELPFLFMNDAGWDQDVPGSYGSDNIARLRNVQAKYDRNQVFQKLVPGGYKLPLSY